MNYKDKSKINGLEEYKKIYNDSIDQNNSFWAENGAKPNDAIKEIDGVAVTQENANQIFSKVFIIIWFNLSYK